MGSFPLLNERDLDLVVSYSTEGEEEMGDAVVNAFLAANIDVFDKPTDLEEWVTTDVLEALQWSADRPLCLCARIWDHHVVITAEEIYIYNCPALG